MKTFDLCYKALWILSWDPDLVWREGLARSEWKKVRSSGQFVPCAVLCCVCFLTVKISSFYFPTFSLPANIENDRENKTKFNKKTLEQIDSQQPGYFSVIKHHCNKEQARGRLKAGERLVTKWAVIFLMRRYYKYYSITGFNGSGRQGVASPLTSHTSWPQMPLYFWANKTKLFSSCMNIIYSATITKFCP